MPKKPQNPNTIIQNKKARFNFEILERLECGIELKGSEVKSLREKNVSIEEAYVRVQAGELWLVGCNIKPYKNATSESIDPIRPRKLLARAREIRKLASPVTVAGMTIVPLYIHFNNRGFAKVTIALARGKTHGDKRQSIRKREDQREIRRAMKR
ncbi:MAG: SsrA-binding protein [Phycisphaerae bacterium]|nr:SsrA-binding protein [Phycisphaerae bacterium]